MERIYDLIRHKNGITALFYRPGVLRKNYISTHLMNEAAEEDVLYFPADSYDSLEDLVEEIKNCEEYEKKEFPDYPNILGAVIIEDIHLLDQSSIDRLKELKEYGVSIILLCKLPRKVDLNPEGRAAYDEDFKTVNGETIEDKDLKHINIDDFENIIEVYSPWDEENLLHKETEFIVHKNKYGDTFIINTVYDAESFDYISAD